MAVFADTSAGVKRYLDEPGASVVHMAPELVFSALTRVELTSALWRRHRDGELTTESTHVLLALFETEWYGDEGHDPAFGVVELDGPVLSTAATLVGRHGLRAGDAIQLASALAARRADPEITDFLCFDRRLRDAARQEGFALLPAEL